MIEGLQQTNISLNKGIVRTPSLGQEGELSECVNLIPHAGEIVRIKEPQSMGLELLDDEILLATNRCAGEENFIVRNGTALKYYRKAENIWLGQEIATLTEEEEAEVVTIGQTLVVSQGATKRYFMWKEGGYKEQNISEFRPRVEMLLGDIRPHTTNADAFASPTSNTDAKIYVGESGYFTQDFPEESSASRVLYNFAFSTGTIEWARFDGVTGSANDGELYEPDTEVLTNLIRGAYNRVREKMRERGLACFPFYVRWGVMLYDGSVVNLSAPILMTPSSVIRPQIGLYCPVNVSKSALLGSQVWSTGATWSFTPLFAARYLYAAIDASTLKGIDEKLVEGIVVYATPEIEVTDKEYDFNYLNFLPVDTSDGKLTDALGNTLNRIVNVNSSGTEPNPKYINLVATLDALKNDDALANAYADMTDPTTFYELMVIPMEMLKSNNYKVVGVIGNGCFPAFKSNSPNIANWDSDAETDFTDEDILYKGLTSEGYAPCHISRVNWSTLSAQKKLASDASSYGDIVIAGANSTYSYNSRLIYGGISLQISPLCSVPQILGENRNPTSRRGAEELNVYARTSGRYLTLSNKGTYLQGFKGEIPVILAPDLFTGMAIEAKGMWSSSITFSKTSALGGYKVWTQLTPPHLRELMDISSMYLPQKAIGDEWHTNDASAAYDKKANSVAVTKVANPWVIEAVYELACGEIYALTSATEALSEGQFGDFPIYAFTDNGIYALSIDRDGTIEAKQPISRDILLGMNSTLQIDKAVIYPTKEGLKLISGRNTSLLSASIAGLNVQESGFSAPSELTITDTEPFQKQLEGIKMVYDYAHRQVHLFGKEEASEGKQKHYVYDLESGQWATQILDKQLTTCVAGYPFSTMQFSTQFGTQLMQYTDELEANDVKQGWLLTRPISFRDPFVRKMLADIRVLGQKTNANTKFKVQVYISEDRVNWNRLTSLKGRSAKWYRFLIMADMCGLDTLTGITCQYVPRLGSKLR